MNRRDASAIQGPSGWRKKKFGLVELYPEKIDSTRPPRPTFEIDGRVG